MAREISEFIVSNLQKNNVINMSIENELEKCIHRNLKLGMHKTIEICGDIFNIDNFRNGVLSNNVVNFNVNGVDILKSNDDLMRILNNHNISVEDFWNRIVNKLKEKCEFLSTKKDAVNKITFLLYEIQYSFIWDVVYIIFFIFILIYLKTF